VTPSPRAFSRYGRGAPFDWPLFARTAYLQPVLLGIALAIVFHPAAHALVTLLGASCAGPVRDAADNVAVVLYVPLVPAAAALAYYAFYARRRLTHAPHRRIADLSLALFLFISAGNAAFLISAGAARWAGFRPELSQVRAACWPAR